MAKGDRRKLKCPETGKESFLTKDAAYRSMKRESWGDTVYTCPHCHLLHTTQVFKKNDYDTAGRKFRIQWRRVRGGKDRRHRKMRRGFDDGHG